MSYETIRFDVSEGIATLTFNRPEKRNALNLEMRREIADAIQRVNLDGDIRALILMSSGGSFCSGGDIATMQTRVPGADAGRRRMRDNWDWVKELVAMDRPVIAAVDGAAVGAGFNIALAADFILATPRAYFCESFAKIGLVPDLGGLYLLPRIVGLQRAKELMLSGREIDAATALSYGIAMEVVPAGSALERAMELSRALAQASPLAAAMTKTALNNSLNSDMRSMLELEATSQGVAFSSDWHREAVRRFLDKRPSPFAWPKRRD